MGTLSEAASPVWAFVGSTLMGCGWSGGAAVVLSATFTGLVGLTGMGMASGLGASTVLGVGATGAGEEVSVARMLFCSLGGLGGSGSELTMVAEMAPAVETLSPQFWPECAWYHQPASAARPTSEACRKREPAMSPPKRLRGAGCGLGWHSVCETTATARTEAKCGGSSLRSE